LCGLTLVLIACTFVLAILNDYPWSRPAAEFVVLLLPVCLLVSAALVGSLVASRQPRNPVGWFIVGYALCITSGEFGREYAIYGVLTGPGSLPLAGAVASLAYWAAFPGGLLLVVFLPLYFPDGRLVSRRWRPVAGLAILVAVLVTAVSVVRPGDDEIRGIPNPLGIESLNDLGFFSNVFGVLLPGLMLLVVLLAVGSLVVRFWRSRGVERQQMKWFVYAAVLFISWIVVAEFVPPIVNEIYFNVSLLAMLAAIGFAVLKYRLYDIDIIINRTLVYGSLTLTLALVYFGGVVGTQTVFRALTGQEQQSQLAVVVSTLAIAALFNPLRRRIQSFIDRLFYRKKYDAAKTLESFSHRLREEVDLENLAGELVAVVEQTIQPAHVSLWLRDREERATMQGER
jgi:hypothetical protein